MKQKIADNLTQQRFKMLKNFIHLLYNHLYHHYYLNLDKNQNKKAIKNH